MRMEKVKIENRISLVIADFSILCLVILKKYIFNVKLYMKVDGLTPLLQVGIIASHYFRQVLKFGQPFLRLVWIKVQLKCLSIFLQIHPYLLCKHCKYWKYRFCLHLCYLEIFLKHRTHFCSISSLELLLCYIALQNLIMPTCF